MNNVYIQCVYNVYTCMYVLLLWVQVHQDWTKKKTTAGLFHSFTGSGLPPLISSDSSSWLTEVGHDVALCL